MKFRITRGEEVLSDMDVEAGEYVIGSGDSAPLKIESEFIAPEHARLRINFRGTGQ